jgi:hypothetical protein
MRERISSAAFQPSGSTGIVWKATSLGSRRSTCRSPSSGSAGSKGVSGSPVQGSVNTDPR